MKDQINQINHVIPILFISFCILILFSPPVLSADNEGKESNSFSIFSNAPRPLPEFDHILHEDAFDDGGCAKCHHVANENSSENSDDDSDDLVYSEGEEAACSECHLEKADDDLLGIREASHASCTGCHRDLKKEKKKAGPTSCGECHKKQE